MPRLLHIDSSARTATSVTRGLSKYFAEQWQINNKSSDITYRDLLGDTVPFIDEQILTALFTPADALTPAQKQSLKASDAFIAELMDADTYIMGVPMYNFTVPAVFKAYIDLISRAGVTFNFIDGRPVGLLKNKKLFVVTSSGSDYSVEPMKGLDHLQPYLRAIFGFLGVTDVSIIGARGHNETEVTKSVESAKRQIDELFSPVPAL